MTDPQDLFRRGLDALDGGDPREAIDCFSRAIGLAPKVAAGYRYRARAHAARNDRHLALADLDTAVRLKPDDAQTRAERAAERFRQRQFDAAVEDCEEAMRLDPGRGDVYGLRGRCHAARGDSPNAHADYAEAARRDPDNAHQFLVLKAKLYYECGQHAACAEAADAALNANADFGPAYEARGMARQVLGDFDGAAADFAAAAAEDPTGLAPLLGRGLALFQAGRWADAEAAANALLAAHPGYEKGLELRALSRQNAGKLDAALDDLNEVVKAAGPRSLALDLRGHLHAVRGDYPAAVRDYLETLRRRPDSAPTLNQLGWLWATCPDEAVRDGAKAKAFATRANELTDFSDPSFLDTLSAAHAECGEFDAAVQWQEKAVALAAPNDEAGYRERLELYRRRLPFRTPPAGR